MAKKFLIGPIVNWIVYAVFTSHVYQFILNMYSCQNWLQVSKMWHLCWFTCDLYAENGPSLQNSRWFYHVFILYNACSVHWGMFSTSGVFSTSEGYHEYIKGISWYMWGDIISTSGDVQCIGVFNINQRLIPPPMYWTSPDVLMISPRCTHGIPPMYWTYIIQGIF